MLLLFFCIYQYDLLNCGVKANVKDEFMDYSITEFWWNGTPGIDQTNRITLQYSFLPTPNGWIMKADNKDWAASSTTPRPEYFPLTWDPVAPHVKKWKQEISSYAAANSRTPTNLVPMLSQVFNYDYTTEEVPEVIRRISKVTQDASSGQLRNSVYKDQTQAVLREEITVTERKESEESATTQIQITDLLNVSMATIGDSMNMDDHDDIKKTTSLKDKSIFLWLMKMLDRPVTIPNGEWRQSDQTDMTTPTTVKEFPKQITVTQSYFQMIETLQEGYMMVFLIELTRLIATKERKVVRDVVKHADQIIHGFYHSGQLQWLGKPLIDLTMKFARLLKELKTDVIQHHAANLHQMLSQRHRKLSVEVNTILEYADIFYDDDEGILLFDALKEFAAYPDISLTGYGLCNSLIHNFLRPYRRLKDTPQRQELMNSVNVLLKSRLSSSGFNKEPPLRGDVQQAGGTPEETVNFQRKRKRHHRSRKRKRERLL